MSFRREDYEYGYEREESGSRKSSRDWSPHRRSRHEGESSGYYAADMQSRSRSSGSSESRRINSRHGHERSPDNTRRYYISKRVESHHGRERGGPPSPRLESQDRRRGLFSSPPVERAELPARRKRSYSSSSSESGSEERRRRRERELRRRKPRRSSLSQTKETDTNKEAKRADRKSVGKKSKKERRKKKSRKQSPSSSSSSSSSDSDSSSSSSASSSSLSSDSDDNKSKKSKKKMSHPQKDKKQSKDKKSKNHTKKKPVIWTKPQDSSGDDSIPSPLLRRDKSEPNVITSAETDVQLIGPVPVGEAPVDSKRLAPMTKEEWDKRQNVIRREVSPTTGRSRLIKGDGEVIEEIVSRERHKEINRLATRADGKHFQDGLKKII